MLLEEQLSKHIPPFTNEEMVITMHEEHHAGNVPVVDHEQEQSAGYESKVPKVYEVDEEESLRLPIEVVEVGPNYFVFDLFRNHIIIKTVY